MGPNFFTQQKITASGGWETLTLQGDCNPDLTEGVKHLSGVVGNLIGYWGLNGNVLDSHTNDLDGTPEGSPMYTAGKLGQAISLNGTSQCVNLGKSSTLCPGNLTISCWANIDPSGGGDYHSLFSKWYWQASNVWLTMSYDFTVYRPTNMIVARLATSDLVGGYFITFADNCPTLTSRWCHYAMTFDSSYLRIYLNGVLVQTLSGCSGTIKERSNIPTLIGARTGNSGDPSRYDWTKGREDDVCLFNRALTPTEIAAIYRLGRGLPYELIRQYPDSSIVEVLLSAGTQNYDWTGRGYTEIWWPGRVLPYLSYDSYGASSGRHYTNYIDVDSLSVAESNIP